MTERRERLHGKVALITGASGGQGRAEARLFAREGAAVILTDVEPSAGTKLATEIADAGGRAMFLSLDVSNEAAWQGVIDAAVAGYGGLHCLVNNAGVVSRLGIMDVSSTEWQKVMDVNVTGALYGMRAAAPVIHASGGGAIVNISSIAGLMAHPAAAYSASKWALRGLTKTAALEFLDWGIRVNSIHPGQVADTVMAGNANAAYRNVMARVTPMGRGAHAEEIAQAVLFLCSDESSYITGTELPVDGGYSEIGLPRLRQQFTREEQGRAGSDTPQSR